MQVNGVAVTLKEPTSIKVFLKNNGYTVERVAVERNGEIIPKATFDDVTLCDSDIIEIVQFMGGG